MGLLSIWIEPCLADTAIWGALHSKVKLEWCVVTISRIHEVPFKYVICIPHYHKLIVGPLVDWESRLNPNCVKARHYLECLLVKQPLFGITSQHY